MQNRELPTLNPELCFVHPNDFWRKHTYHIYQFSLLCHDPGNILISHRRFIKACAKQRNAMIFQRLLNLALRDALLSMLVLCVMAALCRLHHSACCIYVGGCI